MKRTVFALLLCFAGVFPTLMNAQNDLLKAGPMVGSVEMREAIIWAQTNGPATIRIDYFEVQNPSRIFQTAEIRTQAEEAFTAHLICDQLQPGLAYNYRVLVNGREVTRPYTLSFKTPENWRFRSTPPLLRFAVGSCAFVNDALYDRKGKPYGGNYEIFNNILAKKPDMMIWLGDNLYFREPDWYSMVGIHYRYTNARSIPELQPLMGSVANYAIWDDHDYGPNDGDRSFRDKEKTLQGFKNFWANPTYGLPGKGGITTTFERDDCQFFLMDDRWFRTPDNLLPKENRTILGKEQLDWLIEALISSPATFKFVCIGGPVVNSAEVQETYSKIAPSERTYLLDQIARQGIKNVFFLTGDMHFSELSYYSKDGIRIYDLTTSPLTAQAYDPTTITNIYRVRTPNTAVGDRAFSLLEVFGQEGKRRLKIEFYRYDGAKLWEHQIEAQL